MPDKLAHFAINAENVDRAKQFYQRVFGWTFESWGPTDFYVIKGAGVHGALQKRNGPTTVGSTGFEISFAVDNLGDAIEKIEQAGGRVVGNGHRIPTIGSMIGFTDTERNQGIIIEYESARRDELGL